MKHNTLEELLEASKEYIKYKSIGNAAKLNVAIENSQSFLDSLAVEQEAEKNCKHENYTPFYGREGELMEKRCDNCGLDID